MATTRGNGRVHTVAIGASAGGIEAPRRLVPERPKDFPAAVLVVLHLPQGTSVLAQILDRVSPLRAVQAEDEMAIEGGKIYPAGWRCRLRGGQR